MTRARSCCAASGWSRCWRRRAGSNEADALFGRLLDVGNDLCLFAEEYDPDAGLLLGNFPQAFTHLGLITAAFRLDEARRALDDGRTDAAGAAS